MGSACEGEVGSGLYPSFVYIFIADVFACNTCPDEVIYCHLITFSNELDMLHYER